MQILRSLSSSSQLQPLVPVQPLSPSHILSVLFPRCWSVCHQAQLGPLCFLKRSRVVVVCFPALSRKRSAFLKRPHSGWSGNISVLGSQVAWVPILAFPCLPKAPRTKPLFSLPLYPFICKRGWQVQLQISPWMEYSGILILNHTSQESWQGFLKLCRKFCEYRYSFLWVYSFDLILTPFELREYINAEIMSKAGFSSTSAPVTS